MTSQTSRMFLPQSKVASGFYRFPSLSFYIRGCRGLIAI